MSRRQCGPAWHLSSMRPGSWTSPWRSCSARERCISGKSRVLSAEGNTKRWSVRVIVEQEIVQQEISEVQVKNCGCLRGLSAPPPPSPRLLNNTQQWPAGHPSHHSKSRRGHAARPSPTGFHTVVAPAQPFTEQPMQGQRAKS